MTMTHKQKSRIFPVILFLVVVAILAVVLAPRLVSQSKVAQTLQSSAKDKEVAELLATMSNNPNKDSQEYAEARQEFCILTARPAAQREKAVANIRQFLGMPDIPVEFVCSRFNGKPDNSGTDYNSPASETYEAARFSFTVDPKTNYIVETGEAERRWGTKVDGTRWFENMPEYDDTPTYTTPEAIKPVVEAFMIKNKDIFGVDITKMTYQFEGRKIGNFFIKWIDKNNPHTKEYEECGDADRNNPAVYQNDQGVWCLKQTSTTYPTVSMTIMQSGQIAVYDNDGWEIEKL